MYIYRAGSEPGAALVLSPDSIGIHKNGWMIFGAIQPEHVTAMNQFAAVRESDDGTQEFVVGDFQGSIAAPNKAVYDEFFTLFSQTAPISPKKQELLDQIEIKDHFINEDGQKIHYSYEELQLLFRAKYLHFQYEEESNFSALDVDTLKNIKRTLAFIKGKIPEWRKANSMKPKCVYSVWSDCPPPPPDTNKEDLLQQIEVKDHFTDKFGRKIHYNWVEADALVRAKYLYFSAKDEFDFSRLDEWTLMSIIEHISVLKENIIKRRQVSPVVTCSLYYQNKF